MDLDHIRANYRDDILAATARYNADNVRIFGSVARGEETEDSDIDILVHFNKKASLLDESGLDIELNDLIGKKVDLISDRAVRDEFKPFIFGEAEPL